MTWSVSKIPGLSATVIEEIVDDERVPSPSVPTAAGLGLILCHACHGLSPKALDRQACPRCGATLHCRRPDSVTRTWALLIAAYILYIPANVLPIMVTRSLFGSQEDTILSGVVYLWHSGSHMLALVVLVASLIVPLMKMTILTLLLWTVHRGSTSRLRQHTRLYRLVEIIGRWSMLDVFVVALLAALVQAGTLASIIPGGGAMAFSAVVVLTMMASLSFDPRLLWDSLEKNAR